MQSFRCRSNDSFGSQAVRFKASKCFPVCAQKQNRSRYWFLIEAETVRNLCGHQHADVVVLVQPGDLALKHAGSFGSNDWIGEAMKLGHEAPALAV